MTCAIVTFLSIWSCSMALYWRDLLFYLLAYEPSFSMSMVKEISEGILVHLQASPSHTMSIAESSIHAYFVGF